MRGWGMALTMVVLMGFAPSESAAKQWRLVSTPTVAHQQLGELNAVSCVRASACTAVGLYTDRGGHDHNLAERWTGMRWTIQTMPTPRGNAGGDGVSCTTVSSCTAAGGTSGVWAERWRGTSWGLQHPPAVHGGAMVKGVSCASPRACVIVGWAGSVENTRPFAERWNGRRWAVENVPIPRPNFGGAFNAVACAGPNACLAVGSYAKANGQGGLKVLAERWNGKHWRVTPAPNPRGGELIELNGISCTSPSWCVAAGDYQSASVQGLGLAEQWNGRHWKLQHVPGPAGRAGEFYLSAVGCARRGSCIAVGGSSDNAAVGYVLAERLSRNRWSVQRTPNPPGLGGELFGISCTTHVVCMAVGWQQRVTGTSPILRQAPPLQFTERFS